MPATEPLVPATAGLPEAPLCPAAPPLEPSGEVVPPQATPHSNTSASRFLFIESPNGLLQGYHLDSGLPLRSCEVAKSRAIRRRFLVRDSDEADVVEVPGAGAGDDVQDQLEFHVVVFAVYDRDDAGRERQLECREGVRRERREFDGAGRCVRDAG